MTQLYEKSIRKLELPAVLEKLAQQAVCNGAKERCMAMQPLSDVDDIRILQDQTTAACQLITLKGSPSFGGIVDVAASLDRADKGGSLSPGELLRIAGVLRCARGVKAYADGENTSTVLDPYFLRLTPNKYLEEKITNSILSDDEIADAASTELADIRRHIRQQSARIREVLQRIISSPAYAKILQEPIITIRADRFVVPVKSECKNEMQGLIHDVSSSGSTFFIEPIQAVNANNALKELFDQERKEIERILAELSAEAAAYRTHIDENYDILLELDCIFARGKLSFVLEAVRPEIRCDGKINLRNARHPLIDKKTVVPISVHLGEEFDTLIITGPNTGGKTVTLKTLGLLTLMAECGLHIPASDGSYVSVFNKVLADIGDEQSIEQSLSTFSSHMKNIVQIVDCCDENSLVLFDELGAGTDPAEGAALAIALIEYSRSRGARVAATTHYAELKIYAMRTDGVTNASCEFNVETLRPTYRLLIGIPGKSNAFAISRRLGLGEHIIEKAAGMVNENDANFEEVLNQLENQRQLMEKAREEAEALRRETERQKEKSDAYYAEIKRERDKATAAARREAQMIIDEARRTANSVQEELKKLRKQMKDSADASGVNQKQADLRRQLNEAEEKLAEKKKEAPRPKSTREICVGDTVELLKYGTKATVLSITKDGLYELQAGIMKVNAKKEEVYLLEQSTKPTVKRPAPGVSRELKPSASPELDIRGMAVDEALPVLDLFLDNAFRANLTSVRIIHGKGTGILRAAVQDHLRRSKQVKKFRLGVYGEGENGVTIAEMA